jgi:hypothetical protein
MRKGEENQFQAHIISTREHGEGGENLILMLG